MRIPDIRVYNEIMEKSYLVLTALGSDRVGIADDLAALVQEHEGSIEDSRMAVLGGEFAAMLLVEIEPEAADNLESRLKEGEGRLGLSLRLVRTTAPAGMPGGRPYVLEAVALDAPGIVKGLTAVLRRHGVNIEDLETLVSSAPFTGAPLFRLRSRVIIPPGVSLPALRHELAAAEEERDMDVRLEPME